MSIPHDVRRFIDRQIDELDEADRDLLTAASVIRREFATAAVAAALEANAEQVEAACARLARQGVFIVKSGSTIWPDGTPAELYAFRHDLYRELLYDRLPPTRRALMHARVGHRLEAAWAAGWMRSRPSWRSISSAATSLCARSRTISVPLPRRCGAAPTTEAISHLRRALDAIGHIADEDERAGSKSNCALAIGAAFMATRGFGAPEVLEAYARAEALCDRLGERADLFPAIWGQWMFRIGRSEFDRARAALRAAAGLGGTFGQCGSSAAGASRHVGDRVLLAVALAEARAHAEAGLATLRRRRFIRPPASSYGNHDARLLRAQFRRHVAGACRRGASARASMIDPALAAASNLDDPFSLALTLYFTSAAAQMLGDVSASCQKFRSVLAVGDASTR